MNIFNNQSNNGDQLLYSSLSDISSFHEPDFIQPITTSTSIFTDHHFQPHQNYSQQVNGDIALPNILVQIPMCHVYNTQHQSNRQQPNEIKSELKTEIENVTSTIPSTRSTQTSTITTSIPNTNICSQQQTPSNLITARPKSSIKCFKCFQCPFISISQSGLDLHIDKTHNGNQTSVPKKLKCFGCDNVFYSQNSLKVHLVKDHQMSDDEIKFLVQSLVLDGETVDENMLTTPTKQKIYLKKLSILKAPEFESGATGTGSDSYHNFNDGNHYNNEFEQNTLAESYEDVPDDFINLIDDELNEHDDDFIDNSAPNDFQSKIFVKDVNNLKNPTFSTGAQFGFDAGVQSFRIETPQINIIDTSSPLPQTTISNFQNQNFNSNYVDSITDIEPKKKPCKIFIKTVDILPKPIIIQASDNNLTSSPQPQQLYSGNCIIPIGNQNQNTFVRNSNEFPFTFLTSPNRPLNEGRPSVQQNQEKKIFIKNIDILKETNTTSPVAKKNMLHLRTVDDINLMNVNEAQNLIENYQEEPPRSPSITSDSPNNYNEIEDYNINQDQCLESVIEDFVSYYQNNENDKFQFPFQDMHSINFQLGNGNSSDFHLDPNSVDFNPTTDFITLDNITDSTTSSIDEKAVNKTEQFNGNSESQSYFNDCDGTIRNLNGITDYEKAFDEEILFVCAEEVINSSCPEVYESGRMTNEEGQSQMQGNVSNVTEVDIEAKELSKSDEPATGRIYVASNLMKETTETDETIKQSNENISEASNENQMVEVIESNDEEEVECVENDNGKLVQHDATKKTTKRKKGIGRPKGGRNKRYTLDSINSSEDSAIKYQCTQNCAMRFSSSTILSFHEQCHDTNQKNRIICPKCQQNDFRHFNTLHTHLWRQHSIDMELYSCDCCEFKTPILSRLLNTHMRIHSDERNYKCETCNKAFKNAKQLKNHRGLHKERLIRKCEHCDKLFYNKNHLRNHIKAVHDHRKEFKCVYCDIIFSSVVACRTHVLNHTSRSKKYQCGKCSYATNDRSGFRRHLMIHEDKKKYECRYCKFQCIQTKQFKIHMSKQHPGVASEVIFSCQQCRFVTVNQDKFNLHQLHHENKRTEGDVAYEEQVAGDSYDEL